MRLANGSWELDEFRVSSSDLASMTGPFEASKSATEVITVARIATVLPEVLGA